MIRAEFRQSVDVPWTSMTPVTIGRVPSGVGTPATFVTVDDDGTPVLRIDVYAGEPAIDVFRDAQAWGDFIVVGFGDHVHLVSLTSRSVVNVVLTGYFGHLYALPEYLLVADMERLRCFDRSGSSVWQSEGLGVDGVVVHSVEDDVILGDGEWDPPGGWRPFRLALSSGRRVPQPT